MNATRTAKFTLIELMVTVVIITIVLLTIAGVVIGGVILWGAADYRGASIEQRVELQELVKINPKAKELYDEADKNDHVSIKEYKAIKSATKVQDKTQ